MRYLLLFLLLPGCTTYVGIAAHSNIDNPEYSAENPLFTVRATVQKNNFIGFCQHISSIKDKEKGYGLNLCGIEIKLNN